MKKNKVLKITKLMTFIALFYTFITPVYAEDTKWCLDSQPSDVDVAQRYGITLSHEGGSSFRIKMNPPSNQTERCKMKFHISLINGRETTIEDKLSCDKDLVLTITDTVDDTTFGLPGVLVKIESDDKMIKNENEKDSCYYGGGSVTLETSVPIDTTSQDDNCPTIPREDPSLTIPTIDCDNQTYTEGTFEYKFCYAKAHAGNHSYDFTKSGGKFTGSYSDLTFKCESNIDSGKIPLDSKELEGENYYVNKKYIYGKSTETITVGNYKYYFSPGIVTEGSAASCDVTCEEAVEVEYGPPVASKAGMCFEYKVRVTSRTSCNMSKAPELPIVTCAYCTPSPLCVHSDGSVWQQGGPNEEFDACVRSCDGGKYTKSCSNKCYDKVYGPAAKKTSARLQDDVIAIKLENTAYSGSLSDCLSLNPIGCYARDGSGNIEWTAGSSPSRGGEGRWYAEHPGGRYHNGTFMLDSRGFWRRVYENGNICSDACYWTGCGGDVYLNPGMSAKDKEKNMKLYNEAIKTCKSRATCSTTTAEFTISADYTPEGGNKVTIDFPYTTKKDTITHTNSTVIDTSSSDDSTLLPNEPADGEGLLGCYDKNDKKSQNLYRSTWSFPGTWINGKTGEISFTAKTGSTSWREHNDKFCIPADATRVNSDWWNWYYNRVMKKNNIKVSVENDQTVVNKCESTTTNTVVDPKIVKDDEITWNIHAKTNKFGFFEWLIQMDCFYALNPRPTTPTNSNPTTSTTDNACIPSSENYRIRSVDLENVFPALDGATAKQTDEPGRTPGFNWSSYAENTKNENYVSNPKKYMEKVQTLGYGVYQEDSLDYEFTLSPKTIRSMRKDNSSANYSGANYTNFDDSGFYVDSDGVSRYKSNKIRSLSGSNKLPTDNALLCNNMVNYNSSNCDIAG